METASARSTGKIADHRVENDPLEEDEDFVRWRTALQDRINDTKRSMKEQAYKDYSEKLAVVNPLDHVMRERLDRERQADELRIDHLMLTQYKEEIAREKQERRWAAGFQVDSEWSEALIKEQQAILDAIKGEKQDGQVQEPDQATSDLAGDLASVHLDGPSSSTSPAPQPRHRPPPSSDQGIKPTRDGLPDPGKFADSPRRIDSAGSRGRERRSSQRRSSSSSTRLSATGQPEFWRPPIAPDEQLMASRTYSQQSMDAEGVRRRDSVNSLKRSSPYPTNPMPAPAHDAYSPVAQSMGDAAPTTVRSQKEREEVDAAEASWTEINRRNQDKDGPNVTVQETRSSSVRAADSSRPVLGIPFAANGISVSPQATIPPAASVSSKPIVNERPFISEDLSNRTQISPGYTNRTPQTRTAGNGGGTHYHIGGSFEDRQQPQPPRSVQPAYGSYTDDMSASFQSGVAASRPLSKQTSFIRDQTTGQTASRTMTYATISSSPQDARFDVMSHSPPDRMSGSWQRSNLRSRTSIPDLGPAGDDIARSFHTTGSKPIPYRRPSASGESLYESQGSPYSIRRGSRQNVDEFLYYDPLSRSPPDDYQFPRKPASIRSRSSLRDLRYNPYDRPPKWEDPNLSEESEDELSDDRPSILMRKKAAEARRVEEEALRAAEAAEVARRLEEERRQAEEKRLKAEEERRQAEEARRQAEELAAEAVRQAGEVAQEARRQAEEATRKAEELARLEEEAKRQAEEARRKEEAARLKEEEIRRREEEVRRREVELKRKEQHVQLEEQRIREEMMKLTAERKRQDSLGSDSSSPRVSTAGPWPGLNRSGSIGSNSTTWSSSNPSAGSAQSKTTNSTSTSGTSWTSSGQRTNPSPSTPSGRSTNSPSTSTPPPSGWGAANPPKPPNPGSSPYSGNNLSEAEWARRQEEQAKKQQEAFRREQERLENERQAKMSNILTKEDVVRLFAQHERQWNNIMSADELGWSSFPWPVFKRPSDPEEITTAAISAYVLSPHHMSDKSTKDRIKEHIRRWHPDRFETKLLPKVREDEQVKVKEGAGVVARGLNELLTRSNVNSAS